ncbi:hypothetical protein G6F46_002096 [Rhizopus delemar]|uniref:HCP-like protein n=3 Tax=Rhizopus TaxID=4842 RepID=I1CKA5_RHIO9|nr:hypothetical protein RO3G_13596 [Rhizopus delemar RA 99-880]KAG1465430.1 hypothetical protein G6F55_001139 [Rhizopus delemar]KAG1553880.1 hypothetical protein G6F51_000304 [Rhizopus arrhizus]KAG1501422.1 hypothetical protein G6F54_003052 [Rhizopus delemar]KAG1517028.1 hypothetical protein G6F53_001700 [Rhizopus delemar]|eukprot:EIE88885.1 hypothetical protein RO3G_13596 [Rhizopus delemar RA 99-880]
MSNVGFQTQWPQLQAHGIEETNDPLLKGNDDSVIKKSVIKVIPSPKIGVRTLSSNESIKQEAESSNSSSNDHLEPITESDKSINEPNLIPPAAAATNSEKMWPVPETIEQVHMLCEKERAEGNAKSLLALCLHLMESASKVDPDNNILAQDTNFPARHLLLDSIMSSLRQNNSNRTLGQLMVTEARNLLKQLATSGQVSGDPEAQFLLGNCYGMGALGWSVDHGQAFGWYLQASKQGHPEASYRVGVCYELGLGTVKDGARAIMFYKKSAHLLHVPSMYKLGVILMRGYCGHPVSKREAIIWLQRAAAQGETVRVNQEVAMPEVLHALAIIQLTKECEETSMIPDPHYAIELLQRAANLGYAPSQFKLGEYYECGLHVTEDEAKSIHWYQLAAKQNYAEAALALSGWYLTGSLNTQTLPQSDREAYVWARRAALLARRAQLKSVAANAYYSLGIYFENGIGVPQSTEHSIKWFRRAAHFGHPEALNMLSSENDFTKGN